MPLIDLELINQSPNREAMKAKLREVTEQENPTTLTPDQELAIIQTSLDEFKEFIALNTFKLLSFLQRKKIELNISDLAWMETNLDRLHVFLPIVDEDIFLNRQEFDQLKALNENAAAVCAALAHLEKNSCSFGMFERTLTNPSGAYVYADLIKDNSSNKDQVACLAYNYASGLTNLSRTLSNAYGYGVVYYPTMFFNRLLPPPTFEMPLQYQVLFNEKANRFFWGRLMRPNSGVVRYDFFALLDQLHQVGAENTNDLEQVLFNHLRSIGLLLPIDYLSPQTNSSVFNEASCSTEKDTNDTMDADMEIALIVQKKFGLSDMEMREVLRISRLTSTAPTQRGEVLSRSEVFGIYRSKVLLEALIEVRLEKKNRGLRP